MVDVTDSKSVGLIPRVGSSPTTGTMLGRQFCNKLSSKKAPEFWGLSAIFAPIHKIQAVRLTADTVYAYSFSLDRLYEIWCSMYLFVPVCYAFRGHYRSYCSFFITAQFFGSSVSISISLIWLYLKITIKLLAAGLISLFQRSNFP